MCKRRSRNEVFSPDRILFGRLSYLRRKKVRYICKLCQYQVELGWIVVMWTAHTVPILGSFQISSSSHRVSSHFVSLYISLPACLCVFEFFRPPFLRANIWPPYAIKIGTQKWRVKSTIRHLLAHRLLPIMITDRPFGRTVCLCRKVYHWCQKCVCMCCEYMRVSVNKLNSREQKNSVIETDNWTLALYQITLP